MSETTHPVDERLPTGKLAALGLQHVLVMYAGAVAIPLIIGRALKLSPEQVAMLISADLFCCGLVTLQTATAKTDFSYLGLEVFINARLLIEGLKQAGPKLSRENLVTALESMGEKNFGAGVSVKYAPNDRHGSPYVGLTIVNKDGRFIA
jgi:xanthine/uracil permease